MRLREHLGRVLYLFRENAAALYPDKIKGEKLEVPLFRRLTADDMGILAYWNPSLQKSTPAMEDFPSELQSFSKDVLTLLDCFSQFPDFIDEIPDRSFSTELTVSEHIVQMFASYLTPWLSDLGYNLIRLGR